METIIKNVKIINHDSIIECSDIFIDNGLIKDIKLKRGKATSIVVPGFIDTHIHGFAGYDSMDSQMAVKTISKNLIKFGVTSYLPTVMTTKWEDLLKSVKDISEVAKNQKDGAAIVGIHVEGPFISKIRKGAHDERYITVPTVAKINALQKAANGLIKKITVAPEVLTKEVAKAFKENKIIMSVGHSDCTSDQAQKSFDLGAKAVTHLWNAMTGIENRKPGLVEAVLNYDKKIYAELITDLVHVDKETIKLSINVLTPDRVTVITDSINPAGLKDGDYKAGGLPITKKGNKIVLKGTNTIAGSAATMFDNFKNLVKLKYDLKDIVKMTSYNSSLLLNEKKLGQIKKNNIANFVELDLKLNKIIRVYSK